MRVQNRMIRFLLGATALAAIIATAGCAGREPSSPEDVMPNEFEGAPNWVIQGCSAYWGDDGRTRICGIGSAPLTGSESMARTKAKSRAREDIAQSLETKVRNMVTDYRESVTDGEAEMTAEQFTSTTRSLTRMTLNGTQQQDMWLSPSGELYVLMALDIEAFENSVRQMDEMSDQLRTFIERRARDSFAELDEEMEDY